MEFYVWNFLRVCGIVFLVEIAKSEEILLDDSLEYPIIVNTEIDKAVLIVPRNGCHVLNERDGIESLWLKQSLNIYKEDGKTVDDIIKLCELYRNETIDGNQFVDGVRQRAFLIYPGTKWCGAGSSATNDSDFGYNTETDKCCREHDFCQDFVDGFTCHPTNGLCNITPFTRSHCSCDEKFRQCLLRANETASRRIGILYFTIFGLKCFRQDYPAVKCLDFGGFLNIHCQKYLFNCEEELSYQFFDSPKFYYNASEKHSGSPYHCDDEKKEEWKQRAVQMSISLQMTTSSSEVKHLSF